MRFDIYENSESNDARFSLGKSGERVLVVFGVNPSTATKDKSDRTISRINNFIGKFGYDGFIMLNLYPLRSTNPDNLSIVLDEELHKRNLEFIKENIKGRAAVLFAWGNTINKRKYLNRCLCDIAPIIVESGLNTYCLGITKSGNPRHPSRGAVPDHLTLFPTAQYVGERKE